jgi:hypothetical protein
MRRQPLTNLIIWPRLLPCLGLSCPTDRLPVTMPCAFCAEGWITLYDDPTDGPWYHCRRCQSHGDMLELAMLARKLDLGDALAWLHRQAVLKSQPQPAQVKHYTEQILGRRQRAEQDWQEATWRYMLCYPEIDLLQQRFGLNEGPDLPFWDSRMGVYVRAASVAKTLNILSTGTTHKRRYNLRRGLFEGRGWRGVLLVPFHDLPGRLAGFLCVGRRGEADDFRYLRMRPLNAKKDSTRYVESGLCMYDVLYCETYRPDRFHNTIFVSEDPMFALRLQGRHLRDHEVPLPLTGAYPGELQYKTLQHPWQLQPQRPWQDHPGRHWIFLGWQLTPTLLSMAAEADGYIVITEPPTGSWLGLTSNWLERVCGSQQHWTVALEELVLSRPADEVFQFLLRTGLSDVAFREFCRNCGSAALRRLGMAGVAERHQLDNEVAAEAEGKWHQSGIVCRV